MTTGYLYILFNPSLRSNQFKIGKTTRDPRIRAYELSRASGVPQPYEVLFALRVENCEIAERMVHARLAKYRLYRNREFFNLTLERAIEAVQEASNLMEVLLDDGLFDDRPHRDAHPYGNMNASSEMTFNSVGHYDAQEIEIKKSIDFSDQLSRTSEIGQVILLELRDRIRLMGPDISERIASYGHITYSRSSKHVFVELIIKSETIQALFLQLDLETNMSFAVKLNRTVIGEYQQFIRSIRNLSDVENIAPIIEMSYLKAR